MRDRELVEWVRKNSVYDAGLGDFKLPKKLSVYGKVPVMAEKKMKFLAFISFFLISQWFGYK